MGSGILTGLEDCGAPYCRYGGHVCRLRGYNLMFAEIAESAESARALTQSAQTEEDWRKWEGIG